MGEQKVKRTEHPKMVFLQETSPKKVMENDGFLVQICENCTGGYDSSHAVHAVRGARGTAHGVCGVRTSRLPLCSILSTVSNHHAWDNMKPCMSLHSLWGSKSTLTFSILIKIPGSMSTEVCPVFSSTDEPGCFCASSHSQSCPMRVSVYMIYVTACLLAIGAAALSGVILLVQRGTIL